MFKKIYNILLRRFQKKEKGHPHSIKPQRRKVDNEAIRARIKAQGWDLLELPIKKRDAKTGNPIVARWKIVATRGTKSLEVGGQDIDEALKNIGVVLGVIPK